MTEVLKTQATQNPTDAAQTLMTSPEKSGQASQGATTQQASQQQMQPPQGQQATQPVTDSTKAPEKPPEVKYEIKSPEIGDINPVVLETYTKAAQELNLSQDAAQKMLDRLAPVMQEQVSQQVQEVRAEWMNSSKTDKEFGGEKLQENLSVAKKALDTFGSPELRQLLDSSGLGNHPEIIRAFYRAGKSISEDRFVAGSQPSAGSTGPRTFDQLASALYNK